MTNEFLLLLITTVSIAFLHTLTGPDHYLPFIVISRAKKWTTQKTIWFTALCGLGHVGSSILLGFVGIGLGIAVGQLELWEGMRGSVISYVFTAFGFVYLIWGIRKVWRNRPHKHLHYHSDGSLHQHEHTHQQEHAHIHAEEKKVNLTPWILFTIFVFGPCEPLIPLVMYPAAQSSIWSVVIVITIFSIVTIATMLTMVLLVSYGFKLFPTKAIEKYNHVIAGGTILLCGLGMVFLGL